MYERKLCLRCETGRRTYELDSRSAECPYLSGHNGKKCGMYQKMNKPKKEGVLRDFAKRAFCTSPRKISF